MKKVQNLHKINLFFAKMLNNFELPTKTGQILIKLLIRALFQKKILIFATKTFEM